MKPYKSDPEWQAARADYLAEYPDESDNDKLIRTNRAAFRLHEIEARYAASPASVATRPSRG